MKATEFFGLVDIYGAPSPIREDEERRNVGCKQSVVTRYRRGTAVDHTLTLEDGTEITGATPEEVVQKLRAEMRDR